LGTETERWRTTMTQAGHPLGARAARSGRSTASPLRGPFPPPPPHSRVATIQAGCGHYWARATTGLSAAASTSPIAGIAAGSLARRATRPRWGGGGGAAMAASSQRKFPGVFPGRQFDAGLWPGGDGQAHVRDSRMNRWRWWRGNCQRVRRSAPG